MCDLPPLHGLENSITKLASMLICPSLKFKMCTIFYKMQPAKSGQQCCGFRMFIPDQIFTHSGWRIPDPATATKDEWKNNFFS
jgi:hypothetical protein